MTGDEIKRAGYAELDVRWRELIKESNDTPRGGDLTPAAKEMAAISNELRDRRIAREKAKS